MTARAFPPVDPASFARLFEPHTAEQFVDEYWPERSLHIEGDPERVSSLFYMPELRNPTSLFHTHPEDVQLVFRADPTTTNSFGNVFLPPAKAAVLYQSGMTVSFPNMQRSIPMLGAFTQYLEQLTGVMPGTVDAIGALSRPGMGFNRHFDAIDVLIIQIHGTKKWHISQQPAVRYPTVNHVAGTPIIGELHAYAPPAAASWGADPAPSDLRTVLLRPGSVLFVPRGYWHQTEAGSDESFSVSIGFRTPSCADIVLRELHRRLLAHTEWRRPVPGGSGGPAHRTTERALRQMEALLAALDTAVGPMRGTDVLPTRPTFESASQVCQRMRETFVPEATSGLSLIAQFRLIAGQQPEAFYIELADGTMQISEGEHPSPSLRISSSLADFLQFAASPADGPALLEQGRIQVHPMDMKVLGGLLGSFAMFR
ncbi:JmjC domain-containing protein [Polyangium fumosum]|uniref:JmjC domain-containing protein n=1 Tax=Polyangium fumosum TaxID=889272 RepID=A0A4U1IX41_9BACT|nr:cupin domain-containing protein [Polyangium fumosum]TKC98594.1 hypothetical protein E8A74_40710 [Polyangium fumosum]